MVAHKSQLARSCDRCYSLKERCQWNTDSSRCERCIRLNQLCQTKRPTKKPGRPTRIHSVQLSSPRSPRILPSPRLQQNTSDSAISIASTERDELGQIPTSSDVAQFSPIQRLSEMGHLSIPERDLLELRLLKDESMLQFIIGPSFHNEHREYLVSHLVTFVETLKDGYMACALSWTGDEPWPQIGDCYQYAASALSTLRSVEVKDAQGMSLCLALGHAILTFSLRLRANDVLAICRQTLTQIKHTYQQDSARKLLSAGDIGALNYIGLTDLAESLLSGNIPTIRYRICTENTSYVDCYIGLCTSLMPLYYDLGELSHSLLQASRRIVNDETLATEIQKALGELEITIRNWRPNVPEGFTTRFTTTEVLEMLSQAKAMQGAALLILHRLRYPFGSEDTSARAMALDILTQLDMTIRVTKKPIVCVGLQVLVACLELHSDAERAQWLNNISPDGMSTYSEPFNDRIKAIVTAVWVARQQSSRIYWYHLGNTIPTLL
ncbi:fungal specific transcription factor domain-containing protein [Acrodontium crateriforme]|uniref:Fungal specific transcription factor domain-containing protein n=1 Tax=Acrodontium crateriforme TaxID=150365 RepID=A0AAQ3M9K2_9PEZI|nr:fungal specific transcription factor domain-containing protein [Acrodontium crateriforme]